MYFTLLYLWEENVLTYLELDKLKFQLIPKYISKLVDWELESARW